MSEQEFAHTPDNLSEKEWGFVKALCNYEFSTVTDLTEIKKNNPDRETKFEMYIESKERTEELISLLGKAAEEKDFNVRGVIENIKKNDAYKKLVRLSYEWVCLWGKADNMIVSPRIYDLVNLCRYIVRTWIANNRCVTNSFSFVGLRDSAYSMNKTAIQVSSNIFLTVLKNEDGAVHNVLKGRYGNISESFIDVT